MPSAYDSEIAFASHHFIEGVHAKLYELAADPLETRDLFTSSRDVARDFKRALNRIAVPWTAPARSAPRN